MIAIIKRAIGPLVISLAAASTPALAASPTGLWYDHTGRGAVEITDCNGKLCGRIVWVKDNNHKEGCGFQVIGDVRPVAGGKWDGGWIIDPEKDPKHKYDVEITPQGDKLKVMGYAGVKFLSETMIWTRVRPSRLRHPFPLLPLPAATTTSRRPSIRPRRQRLRRHRRRPQIPSRPSRSSARRPRPPSSRARTARSSSRASPSLSLAQTDASSTPMTRATPSPACRHAEARRASAGQ
jgi:uncharacterized protein (DUF2147 family)